MLTSSISRSHTPFIRLTTSFRTCFVRSLREITYWYPFSVLSVVVFKGWTQIFCPTDRSQVFDVNKDLLESVLLNCSLGFSRRHNMPVLNNHFGMKRGASDDNGRASCQKRALFAVVALLDSGTVRSLPRGQFADGDALQRLLPLRPPCLSG